MQTHISTNLDHLVKTHDIHLSAWDNTDVKVLIVRLAKEYTRWGNDRI